MKYLLAVYAALLAHLAFAQNTLLPVELFSEGEQYSDVRLSPTGEYLSVISEMDGKNILIIIDRKINKPTYVVRFPANAQVGDYTWVNDERVVVAKEYLRGWRDHPEYYGELFAVNADGSQKKQIVGYQGEQQTGTNIKKAEPLYGTSYILDPLFDDDKNMLIYTIPWSNNRHRETETVVYRLNVKTGLRKKVAHSPSKRASFLTDEQGFVRVAFATDDAVTGTFYIREASSKADWEKFELDLALRDISLHGFDESGEHIFFTASNSGEAQGLYKLNLDTQEAEKIFQDEVVSPKRIWADPISKEVFAIETEADYPTYSFVNTSSPHTKMLKAMIAALPGNQVQIVSTTRNGNTMVVFAQSDIDAGVFYLFDKTKNNLSFLFAAREKVDPELMSETKPIQFEARDGVKIHGYLTLPFGKEPKDLPLVVMPHGGPHGPRDWWAYDSEAQLLANRGIAVLKVNFRGSGGYGKAFEYSGHRKWGAEIQYDIIDATRYVIEQGYADKNNMCIMGASFGAYSALQTSIIEPELFKCAIGVVGVYDLPLMFNEGDVSKSRIGQNYLTRVLGTNQAQLQSFSPSYNAEKLTASVLIVHGGEDERAPIEQAESIISAMKQANHPYEYFLLEDEGHGFYKPEHRAAYYNRALTFLGKHLEF